jgi:hypothetical protein
LAYRGGEIIKGRCGSHAGASIAERKESVRLVSGVVYRNGEGVYLECRWVAFLECTGVVSMYRNSLRTKLVSQLCALDVLRALTPPGWMVVGVMVMVPTRLASAQRTRESSEAAEAKAPRERRIAGRVNFMMKEKWRWRVDKVRMSMRSKDTKRRRVYIPPLPRRACSPWLLCRESVSMVQAHCRAQRSYQVASLCKLGKRHSWWLAIINTSLMHH